ncbi:5-(carboxyamino)imidazole ribonucleotide synthase [Paraglaciecola sp.]|uniref:5-(carboxyamino)imidazole ribonucleotide synthase n=1 Tax=Paraglaciecola sp. TaxID=1920173 RepID=UPI0030F49252
MNILILGSGQLARMMALAGYPLGLSVAAVDVNARNVVDPITKIVSEKLLIQALKDADVISVEFEHIPQDLLEQVNATGKLMPSMESIMAGADRVKEKKLLSGLNIANCPYKIITDVNQLDAAVTELGEQLIIKASRDGYDGYGQWRLSGAAQLADIKQQLSELDLQKVPLVVEKMLNFERELSLVGVRSVSGQIAYYPLAENLHHQGQLHVSVAPAPHVNEALNQQAQDIFNQLVEALGYVGVLAVEFFQMGDQLLVNEIAPRVHNSGHWSMQGADTCQFENHLRAISDLPLGATKVLTPTAMINIIGCDDFSMDVLNIQGCHLHLYGKTVRAKRKMGHFNLCADSYAALGHTLQDLAQYLAQEHFPLLKKEANRLLNV